MEKESLSREIYEKAIQCGFDDCGIIPMDAMDGFDDFCEKRIHDVPESRILYEHVGDLKGTKKRFPWARSIVILSWWFGKYRFPKELQGRYAKAYFLHPGKKTGEGYDLAALERWFAEKGIRAEGGDHLQFLSIGPLRWMAVRAGLGIFRKNNFFYSKKGSWNTLAGYVIDRECELIRKADLPPCPKKCDLCLRACRTQALQAPYTLNPLKCVSFLTTFGNAGVPEGFHPDMFQEWVCGCDNCQDACPFNHGQDWSAGRPFPHLEETAPRILPEDYGRLSDEFLIEEVISRTNSHLQPSQVASLRVNAARSLRFQQEHGKDS